MSWWLVTRTANVIFFTKKRSYLFSYFLWHETNIFEAKFVYMEETWGGSLLFSPIGQKMNLQIAQYNMTGSKPMENMQKRWPRKKSKGET